ncbi:unnamed protein product, partial [Ixodes persulcatus]
SPAPSQLRHPKTFAGLREDDVEDWLDIYERVSLYNKWDDHAKLRNAIFYLSDVAKIWFTNHEDEIVTWLLFKTQLAEIFGKPANRKAVAERKLAARIQSSGETYTSYIEDVFALFRRFDKDMSEAYRVRHVMKGISEEAFNVLLVQNPTTVKDITTHCQRLDEARNSRLQVRALHDGSSITMPSLSTDTLKQMIQKIVRDELSHFLRPAASHQTIESDDSGLRRIIQQEIASVVTPTATSSNVTDGLRTSDETLRSGVPPMIPDLPALASISPAFNRGPLPPWSSHPTYPNYRSWGYRPRPICHYCGITGHVARVCRRRQQDYETRDYYSRERNNRGYWKKPRDQSPPPEPYPARRPEAPWRRSPSPYPRSFSPMISRRGARPNTGN